MKRYIFSFLFLSLAVSLFAQTHMRVWQNNENTSMKIAKVGDMVFCDGAVSIKGVNYKLSDIDSIVVVPEVTVQYDGATATVNIPASVQKTVTATVTGADVVLTNTDVSNEIEVVLAGTSTNGSFTYNGSYKATFYLNGLNLTSATGGAIDIECGKRNALVLVEGTTNTLVDKVGGTQKACLYCKGHLEIEGAGTLNVTGNAKHAIATKEYLQLKKSTGNINIVKAASDAIHAGQYFQMNGGNVNIDANTVADGIQAEGILAADGSLDASEEYNGQVIVKGGTITATISHQDCKGIKADSDITVSGGTFNITASGNGSRGIQCDGKLNISEADGTTSITVLATGARCTLEECEDDPHRCVGMKIDGGLYMTAGTVKVTATGSKSRSIQVPTGGYNVSGGTVSASPAATIK